MREPLPDVSKHHLEQVYLPLLAWLDKTQREAGRRILVGLAGVPGGGKSTFAAVLEKASRPLMSPDQLKVVGMDGWHLPNAVLDARTTTDAEGHAVSLRHRKGSPATFDVNGLVDALTRIAQEEKTVHLPAYDRTLHEPVPDAISIPPATRIVLVEGNYLLLHEPPWDQVAGLWDRRLFLDCDPAVARDRIIARHERGGLSPAEATRKFGTNDQPNTQTVLATRDQADMLITLAPDPVLLFRGGS